MFRILRRKKKKKERKTKNLKKTLEPKTREKTKEKTGKKKQKIPIYPALTRRPNCVPMRAKRRIGFTDFVFARKAHVLAWPKTHENLFDESFMPYARC
jgi:hypothetical protein